MSADLVTQAKTYTDVIQPRADVEFRVGLGSGHGFKPALCDQFLGKQQIIRPLETGSDVAFVTDENRRLQLEPIWCEPL